MARTPVMAAIGLAVVATVALSGQALTASNTVPASTAGYGSAAVSGATATSVAYTLSADGTSITAVSLVFSGDQSTKTVKIGFNAGAQSSCTVGAHNVGTDSTPATCSGLAQSTATATSLSVSVFQ